jgi:hypothetical protein
MAKSAHAAFTPSEEDNEVRSETVEKEDAVPVAEDRDEPVTEYTTNGAFEGRVEDEEVFDIDDWSVRPSSKKDKT